MKEQYSIENSEIESISRDRDDELKYSSKIVLANHLKELLNR